MGPLSLLPVVLMLAAAPAVGQRIGDPFVTLSPIAPPEIGVVIEGLDLEGRTLDSATPLHLAAASVRDGELIRAMVRRGARVDARDVEGLTPLHYAAAAAAPAEVLAALIEAGAALGARDVSGRTPLHLAGTVETVAALALAGADPCALDVTGAPALPVAGLEAIRMEAPEAYPIISAAFLDCL